MKYLLMLAPFLCYPASAAVKLVVPENFCAPAKTLMAKSEGCEDNKIFSAAAKTCLGNIDLEAKKLGLDIKTLQRKAAQSQTGDMKSAAKEYFELTRKLDYLIGITEISRIEAYNYVEHLYRPEDEADDPADNMKVACFGDNVEALEAIAAQMDKKQYELEALLELTKNQLLQTQQNAGDMRSLHPAGPAIPPASIPTKTAPKGPKGKNSNASDISGTKKDESKK